MKSTMPIIVAPAADAGPSFLRTLGDLAKVTIVAVGAYSALLGILLYRYG
jgi:hypothetical protein